MTVSFEKFNYLKMMDGVILEMNRKAKDYPISRVRYVDIKYAWRDLK
jgi:hypothetical protein